MSLWSSLAQRESRQKRVEIMGDWPLQFASSVSAESSPDGLNTRMINVAAIRMQQFGVQFYQASLTAGDIDKLVRFEVLNYGESGQPVRGGNKKAPSKVNWDLLERRIASSEKAYQRQIIRRKIDELVQYYEQCRQARDLPSIAGRRHHLVRREAHVRAGRERRVGRPSQGAGARGHPARDRRPAPPARAARRHRQHARTRTSRCRRSSSIVCRKITSCRCL